MKHDRPRSASRQGEAGAAPSYRARHPSATRPNRRRPRRRCNNAGHGPRGALRRPADEPHRVLPVLDRRPRARARLLRGTAPRRRRGVGRRDARRCRRRLGAPRSELADRRRRPRPRRVRRSRARLPEPTAVVLLDEDRPEYLGGQFVHATLASLDWDRLAEVFRTGVPVRERPDRYRASIERLTLQDVAVFFEEALAALPELVVDLQRGLRVADLHCGGARWLIAVARRFPATTLVGVEAQPDSAARARRNVAEAGLAGRITIEEADVASIARRAGAFGLVYFQYALHELADPVGALRAGWEALAPGGWLVVLDWCEPSTPDEYRSLHGQLVAGIQLDQLLMGTRLRTVEEFLGFFAAAGLPAPQVIDLPSGATLVVTTKPSSDLGGDQRRAIEGSG
ncbi:MAG: hypothetical protein KatS3mg065_0746 [Chloroflexota bacterium]|nr:MAG: hypothetical protein KatS3mg065_0746 [Chloroflexota bacterium]